VRERARESESEGERARARATESESERAREREEEKERTGEEERKRAHVSTVDKIHFRAVHNISADDTAKPLTPEESTHFRRSAGGGPV
jgi:hypothetical protein